MPGKRENAVTEEERANKLKVYAQYMAIQRSGQTNMFYKNMVQRIAFENGFYALVNEIEEVGYPTILKEYSEWADQVDEADIPECGELESTYSVRYK